VRVQLLGGFLGAGKTTAIRALASLLAARGEKVAVVTNDQGDALVDTGLCEEVASHLSEIGGGCFCCQYGDLEEALEEARSSGATVALAEAVGSCTDLVATVLSPLAERKAEALRLAPLSVLVDPYRARDIEAGAFPEDVRYLFRKQIEEADVVVLTRADLDPPDVEPFIRSIRPEASIVRVSSSSGDGVDRWLATMPETLARPLDIDYDRYAAAEALLGWANGRVAVHADQPFAPREAIERFFAAFADDPVAHLKILVQDPAAGSANLVRRGAKAELHLDSLPSQTDHLMLTVNARIAMTPSELEPKLKEALAKAVPGARIAWSELECFKPGRPVPVHRYAKRTEPTDDASCCALFYERPDVRYLLGESFHPGGSKLTLELAGQLELTEGARILDVASGRGASLKAIMKQYSVSAVGMDFAAAPESDNPKLELIRGDAHDIPFDSERFDAAICECALSTFADQPRALAEAFRVLRPGGRLAVSDMLANGPIPEELAGWVHVGTCLSHARSLSDYAALLEAAGFEILCTEESSWALREMLGGIKRKLVAAALGKATGAIGDGIELDIKKGRNAIRQAEAAMRDGVVGYGYLIARKPNTRS